MNYLIIHKQSNLVVNVVCSSNRIAESSTHRAIRISDSVLDKYYNLKMQKSRNGSLVDAGEMANVSPAFKELLG